MQVADLGCIEDVHDLLEDRVTIALMFLTEHLNVTQLAKVEVTFLLQRIDCLLRLLQLCAVRQWISKHNSINN